MTSLSEKLKGRFIVIDGPDGAGKSTQINLLTAHLVGHGVALQPARDPGGTPIGDRIRAILLDKAHSEMCVPCELMLYMASRAQLAAEVIRPALARGMCVLCDRYVSSTIAYQGAGGIAPQAIRQAADVAIAGLWPDLTIILDIESHAGLARAGRAGGADRMESKALEFHQLVRQSFLAQARQDPAHFAVVDAGGEPHEVQQRLQQVIADWRFK